MKNLVVISSQLRKLSHLLFNTGGTGKTLKNTSLKYLPKRLFEWVEG